VASSALLFVPAGFSRGFDDWAEVGADPITKDGRAADKVLLATASALDRRTSGRFFLYVHFMDVHDFAAPLDDPYDRAVRRVDTSVGILVKLLEAWDLRDGTVFVLTSDHGERFFEKHPIKGEAKHLGNPSFDYLLRVPLFDLERDPEETQNVAAEHPHVVENHERCVDELSEKLSTVVIPKNVVTAEDLRRLQSLGYATE
jgi:hypothetical protein